MKLHGRMVVKEIEGTVYWGLVRYRGLDRPGKNYFRIYYHDGDSGETMSEAEVLEHIQPKNAVWAPAVGPPELPPEDEFDEQDETSNEVR